MQKHWNNATTNWFKVDRKRLREWHVKKNEIMDFSSKKGGNLQN